MDDPAVWTLIALLGASSASMVAVVTFALTSGFRRVEDRLGRVEDRMTGVERSLDRIDRRLDHPGEGAEH